MGWCLLRGVEFWDKYTPEVSDLLRNRRGEKASAGVEDQTADEAQPEDCHQGHQIKRRWFLHRRESTSEVPSAETLQAVWEFEP